ncbi:MAG: hypothetical protein JXA89_00890 [Anaerolineae bacterium]|nr:hypothetical protein [Anaerolineae bacterium]
MRLIAAATIRERAIHFLSRWHPRLVSGIGIVILLEAIQALSSGLFRPADTLIRWLFVQSILEISLWAGRIRIDRHRWAFPWPSIVLFLLFAGSAAILALTAHTLAAWAACVLFYASLTNLSGICLRWPWPVRLPGWMLFAVVGGVLPVMVEQIESQFAQEEFFAVLQVVALSVLSGGLVATRAWIATRDHSRSQAPLEKHKPVYVPGWVVAVAVAGAILVGSGLSIRAYQQSFYAETAPVYQQSPFLCGSAAQDPAEPGGEETFQRLIAQMETNPQHTTLEYGMLALATGNRQWAETFRLNILHDAQEAMFTEPANSVKFGQYLASQRAFFFVHVHRAFPDLFSEQDVNTITTWLNAVNRRALTVEWVDWMYALAFSYWPEGPYENQESGAGLLAVLERYRLSDDLLTARNQDYLARHQRGWVERFRNTDDAYIYQPEWITNALFQAEYWNNVTGSGPEISQNQALSFEWLLLQALPDGSPMAYNHPARHSFAQTAYLAAILLDDPRYVWWSARMLDWAEHTDTPFYAQPGIEQTTSLTGISPDTGSCVMFGDSGLPTQRGPLAPDKIVFRDGWLPQSQYLLLNLRFSGWHRYKATNSVSMIYQDGPLVIEQDSGEPFSWLPSGRSVFRDKRIPRENLNGLLVSKTGISAVLYKLTGFDGPWAQDPPHYARVDRFETLGPLDVSRTIVDEWHGWQHIRTIYFFHAGPIVVVDEAVNALYGSTVALSWHLVGQGRSQDSSLWLREGQDGARVTWSPETWSAMDTEHRPGTPSSVDVLYRSPDRDRLSLATVWLLDEWANSQDQITTLWQPDSNLALGQHVKLTGTAGSIELLHNGTRQPLSADGLQIDGEAAVVWQNPQGEIQACAVGASAVEMTLANPPGRITTLDGRALPAGAWEWHQEKLVIRQTEESWCVKIN